MEKTEKRDSRYFARSYQFGLGWTLDGHLPANSRDHHRCLGAPKSSSKSSRRILSIFNRSRTLVANKYKESSSNFDCDSYAASTLSSPAFFCISWLVSAVKFMTWANIFLSTRYTSREEYTSDLFIVSARFCVTSSEFLTT